MPKSASREDRLDSASEPTFTPRFLVCLLLIAVGIAWIVYYYLAVRAGADGKLGGPKVLQTLSDARGVNWNYVGGFALVFIGLALTAHPSTPLGRGRGIVVGMLGCFLVGLLWICTFYVVSDDPSAIPVINDLGQYNLLVGIGLMAVGFTFATRWE